MSQRHCWFLRQYSLVNSDPDRAELQFQNQQLDLSNYNHLIWLVQFILSPLIMPGDEFWIGVPTEWEWV